MFHVEHRLRQPMALVASLARPARIARKGRRYIVRSLPLAALIVGWRTHSFDSAATTSSARSELE